MFTLLCNVKLTRRQEMCFIVNGSNTLAWSGKDVHAAISFLIDEGESIFYLDGGDGTEVLEMRARKV